jgi:hypothetical protein
MDYRKVPDPQFETKLINGAQYRTIVTQPGSVEQKLADWRPSKKGNSLTMQTNDDDEPINELCGVSNPFAGVVDDGGD